MAGRVAGRRLLLSVDARGYGRADGRRQVAIQQGLIDLLTTAAEAANLRRAEWDCQKAGDGELAVLPADTPENVLIDDFVRQLAERVADYNEDRRDEARLRLRLAIHNGVVEPGVNGWAGAGSVVVSRLVNSEPLRKAQETMPTAGLVVLLSNRVFLDTVVQGHTALRASRFLRVSVRNKEYQDDAWLFSPDGDVRKLPMGDSPARPHPVSPAEEQRPNQHAGTTRPNASVINNFHHEVTAEVIGIQENRHG